MKALLDEAEVQEIIGYLKCCKNNKVPDLIARLEKKMESTPLMDKIRQIAIDSCGREGELEFDEGCVVSIDDSPNHCPDGAYVMGWYWVGNPEQDEEPQLIKLEKLGGEIIGIVRTQYSVNKATAIMLKIKWPPGEGPEIEEQALSCNLIEAVGGVPSHELPKGEFYVKAWSENEELYKAMLEHGIIESAHKTARPMGSHVVAPVCRLTDKGEKWVEERVP